MHTFNEDKRKLLLNRFTEVEKDWMRWQQNAGPYWNKRLKRAFFFPYKYSILLLSRVFPFKLTMHTFWGEKMIGLMPEYHWMVFKTLPEDGEIALTRFLLKHLQPKEIFFDIGANCGFYTMLASFLLGDTGNVHSFEPTPNIFLLLKKNTIHKHNIFLNNSALSDMVGTIDFFTNPVCSSLNSVFNYDPSIQKKILVKTTTIDEYCRARKITPTFLKIDVERGEENVIRGAKNTLSSFEPTIAMEIWRRNNEPHIRAANMLMSMKYLPYRINLEGELESLTRDIDGRDLSLLISPKYEADNFIFIKNVNRKFLNDQRN